jgi:hypothetical protein
MIRTRHLFISLGLAIATLPGCMVRGSGSVTASGPAVVYQEPPAPQVESSPTRSGYLWVHGHWDWRNAQWTWVGGHWERERQGYAWSEGRWERRGSSWHWIEGTWAVSNTNMPPRDVSNASGGVVVSGGPSGRYPTSAPPPLRVESAAARPGFVFIRGRWNWANGRWDWSEGHWERTRTAQMWVDGRWELQGNYYVWVEGRWEAAPAPSGPVIRDHRK